MSTKIPGTSVRHVVITPTCRRTLMDLGALNVAMEEIRMEYITLLNKVHNEEATFHLILTIKKKA